MAQRCVRPWESATAHVSRADPEVDYACAVQQVPDDVTVGCTAHLEQTSPLGKTIAVYIFENLGYTISACFCFYLISFLNRPVDSSYFFLIKLSKYGTMFLIL